MTERILRRVEPWNEMQWEDECGCSWRFDLTRRLGEELIWAPCSTHEKMPKKSRKAPVRAKKAPEPTKMATASHSTGNGHSEAPVSLDTTVTQAKPPKATQQTLIGNPRKTINLENPEICDSCQ